MALRQRLINASNISEITLMSPADIVFLYSDGVYDGSDDDRARLERIVRDHKHLGAKEICNAILDYAVERDDPLHNTGQEDSIDDKTAFIIKHG
jgi:hypothetical protein